MTHISSPNIEMLPAYQRLASSLDSLPNRFPSAADGAHLRILAKLFTPEEAELAACLHMELETPTLIAGRSGYSVSEVTSLLKEMANKGLIHFGKTAQGRPGFGLMPFVVGIYEAQIGRIDGELARLFEDYYYSAFGKALAITPQVHRVIPIGESVKNDLEVRPFESASSLVDQMQSWGVIDCICRTQKALIGQACEHPLDVCMVLSSSPGAFSSGGPLRVLTQAEAQQTLRRAAQAGLVHCVSNNQRDLWYICNCCTCSCGILRGMKDLGMANVVARSAFVSRVNEDQCAGCEECLPACQFGAIRVDGIAVVETIRCAGCGQCVQACPQGALALERRMGEAAPPIDEEGWRSARLRNSTPG